MTQQAFGDFYKNRDTLNVAAPGKESTLVFSVPDGKEKALVLKFLFEPNAGRSYLEVNHYPHMVGPNPELHTRSHLAQNLAGNGDDIELKARISYYVEKKKLVETGSDDVARIAQLNKLIERCKNKESGWFFFVEPGSPVIKAIKLGTSVINQLFGKEYKGHAPIPSLITAVSQKGISPYDVTSDNCELGWFRIYKTGSKLGTKYHVELAETETAVEVDGETFTKKKPARHELHKKIKTLDLTLADFPDPMAFEKKQAFTMEETEAFINSSYTKVPERLLKTNAAGAVQRPATVAPTDNYIPDLDMPGLEAASVEISELSYDELPF